MSSRTRKKEVEPKEVEVKAVEAVEVEQVPRFSKADLIASAATFGVMPEVAAGAFFHVEDATEAEAKQLITDFLQKPKEVVKEGAN